MSAQTVISCPKCGTRLEVESTRTCQCPKCGALLSVRPSNPPPLPVPLPQAESPARARPRSPAKVRRDDDEDAGPAPRRRGPWIALALFVALLVVGGVIASRHYLRPQPPPDDRPKLLPEETVHHELSGDEVYRHLLRSTALIVTPNSGLGSGVLVDRNRRLVLTNSHVVERHKKVAVLFPAFDQSKQIISDPKYYIQRKEERGLIGEVVANEPRRDLALVRLEKLPAEVRAVGIARQPAATGSTVYSIGSSGANEELFWRFTTGSVRGRTKRTYRDGDGSRDYMCLETQSPTNKGDSGGPVVNGRVELVAVVAAISRTDRLVSMNVDLSEVRDFVGDYFRSINETWKEPESDLPRPATPSEVMDNLIAVLQAGAPGDRVTAARRLGNLGKDARVAVPQLLAGLTSDDPALVGAITTSLDQIGPPEPGKELVLVQSLQSGPLAARQYAAKSFATEINVPVDSVKDVVAALQDESPHVRALMAQGIGKVGVRARLAALAPLLDRLTDPDPAVREASTAAIKALGPPDRGDQTVLLSRLKHQDFRVRVAVLTLFSSLISTLEDVKRVEDLCRDKSPEVRTAVAKVFGAAGSKARPATLGLLLDGLADKEETVRSACTAAIEAVGKPDENDQESLIGRTRHTNPRVRMLAVTLLAPFALHKDSAKALTEAMNDELPEIRVVAIKAFGDAGPRVRALSLGLLLERIADKDEQVRIAAVGALKGVGVPDDNDRGTLFKRLSHFDVRVRKTVLDMITPLISSKEFALEVWVPLLKDPEVQLRTVAVGKLVSSKELLASAGNDLLGLLPDPDSSIRLVVANTARQLKDVNQVNEKLTRQLERETEPVVKEMLALSLLALTEARDRNLDTFRRFLKDPSPAVRIESMKKVAAIGPEAAITIPVLIELIGDESTYVRVGALEALAAMDSKSKPAVPLVAGLFDRSETPVSVQIAAVKMLGNAGGEGMSRLLTISKKTLPESVREEMCRSFAASSVISDETRQWLIDQAERLPAIREVVADAVVKSGTNATVEELIRRTYPYKPRKPGEKETRYPIDYRKWVLITLRKMDVAKITTKDNRRILIERLEYLSKNDVDSDVVTEAQATLTKLSR